MRFFVTRKFVIVTPAVLVFITHKRSTVMRLTGYSVLIIAVNIALVNIVVVVPVATVYAKIDPDRGIRLIFPVAHPKDPVFFSKFPAIRSPQGYGFFFELASD